MYSICKNICPIYRMYLTLCVIIRQPLIFQRMNWEKVQIVYLVKYGILSRSWRLSLKVDISNSSTMLPVSPGCVKYYNNLCDMYWPVCIMDCAE
jgi:hypothetical protein